MILIFIGFFICIYLFYDTCKLHDSCTKNDIFHYESQHNFYNVNHEELTSAQSELDRFENIYTSTIKKNKMKLEKLNEEILKEIENYNVDFTENRDLEKEVNSQVNSIDINELKDIIMGVKK